MASTTPRLGLHMPADDGSEPINVATDLNDNLEKLDSVSGFIPSTEFTPPPGIYDGMATYETDTGRAKFRKGIAGTWAYILTAGTTFVAHVVLGIGYRLGLGTNDPQAAIEIVVNNVLSTANVLKFRQSDHSFPVMQIDRDGIKIGPGGSSDMDIRIYRPTTNQLAIQGSVSMNAGLDVTGTTAVDDLNVSNDINIGGRVMGDLDIQGSLSVGGLGLYDVRIRTTDLSRASNASTNADTAFDFTLEANTTYLIELFMMVGGDPSGDFRIAWIPPAGSTGPRHVVAMASAQTSAATATMITAVFNLTSSVVSGCQATTVYAGHSETVVLTTGGTGGLLQLGWGQGTSNGVATTVKAGSIMRIRKVA